MRKRRAVVVRRLSQAGSELSNVNIQPPSWLCSPFPHSSLQEAHLSQCLALPFIKLKLSDLVKALILCIQELNFLV